MKSIGCAVFLGSLCLLSACVKTSGVMQLAPGTYNIVTSDELGGVIGAKKAGLEQATAYCAERGKQMIVMQSQSDVRRDWVNDPVAHHDVTFRCAAPGERVQTVMGGSQDSLVVR